MRANSLALRLFVSATAWTVVILLITGIVLSSIYRQAVERAFDRRLGVYLRTLVADVASPEEASDKFPQSLGEPLFELPLSGWYWQVTRLDPDKHDVRSSRSLWDAGLPHLQDRGVAAGPDGTREGYVDGPEDQRLRLVERNIDLGDEGHYLVAVAGDAAEITDEVAFVRPGADHHVFDPRRGAAAHHHVPGALRARPAQAHHRQPRRHPLRQRRTARRGNSRTRSRRSRARPTR